MNSPLAIPSPPIAEINLGPIALRAYALMIIIGIIVAMYMFKKRYEREGGPGERAVDLAFWMIPFGIIGGRLYHVISSPAAYFGPGGNPINAFKIWEGGLGIWGAIALGAVGAIIGARYYGLRMTPIMDAVAPALLVAQAIGRLGNWFNQELYGAPTTLPWGLQIDDAHLVPGYESGTLFHPTFLYELLWNLAAAAFVIWAGRKWQLRHGRQFWLYVMAYTAGRVWIEMLRIDNAEHILGLRLNVWTSIIIFVLGLVLFLLASKKGTEPDPIYRDKHDETEDVADEPDPAAATSADTETPSTAASPEPPPSDR